ncbi:MAG: SDR family NAD(P)-dependent oxidoreductase [Nitratireductor sp.]
MKLYTAKPSDGAIWITGASSGIGAQLAQELVQEGFSVYASARSKDKLKALESQITAKGYSGEFISLPLDVTDEKACIKAHESILSKEGALAGVILNAATYLPIRANELSTKNFNTTMNVNFTGVTNCLVPALAEFHTQGYGQVVIVSSVTGYGGLIKAASYGASKAALINMAECLKFDLDSQNIKIQIVTPGFVKTPLTEQNDFPMPFIMPVEKAAKRIVDKMKSNGFEITLPRRFTYMLKAVNLLPYPMYFWLVKKITGSA